MNPDPVSSAGDRRDFFRRVAVGGLTAITATLLARRSNGECVNEGVCRGCVAYEDCNLPRALSTKQVLGRKQPR